MQFGLLGINYKKAQLDIRDKTSFTDTKKINLFQKAEQAGIEQCMVLSTCNRSEIYFFYDSEQTWSRMLQIYIEMFPEVKLDKYLVQMRGEEAVTYLFRVAAGLESLVLGEDQILGQVKEALDFSRTMGVSGKEMNYVVREAVTCAKKIKTDYRMSEKPLSVSYIGIQKLEEICGIAGKKVLVIGSGKTAVLALRYLYEYHAGPIFTCSRTFSHARELREKFPDIEVIDYGQRYLVMEECDIVVSATSSPHLVVRREEFEPRRNMVFLDLAAPRDIDTEFCGSSMVQLINLDTLQKISDQNQKERERMVEVCQKRIEESVEEAKRWLLQSRVDGTIQSLQQRCEEIVTDSCGYLERKIELSQREQKLLRKVLHASLLRLLREPIQELKQIDSEEVQNQYKEMVNHLFHI